MKNVTYFKNFYSHLENDRLKKIWEENGGQEKEKFFDFFYPQMIDVKNPVILEFGVRAGFSTSIFLDLCKINNGQLYSIDINDYSELFKDKNWNFIRSRDDDFDFIEDKIPKKFDLICIDTLHKANHVEKILYYYYKRLKLNGMIIIDDISWLLYASDSKRNNFFREINNKETFNKLLAIYNGNRENILLEVNFTSSGSAKITKITDNNLNKPKKIKSREFGISNLIKKLLNK
tara:strand:- start:65 stop:763 length:699 start_codon:yes stop_codon:yes gene_type:complete